jgi:quercetin dioxygenase-like cupin family protein
VSGGRIEGDRRRPAARCLLAAALVAGLLLASRPAAAQAPGGAVQEQVLVDNDTVRVSLLVFLPGSASGEHVGLDPELGIVLEGELALVTPAGREVLGPGAVRWLPALVPHDARNEGSLPLRLWVVVVKR